MCCPSPPSQRMKNASAPPTGCSIGEEQAKRELAEAERWHDVGEADSEPPQPRFRPDRVPGPQLNRTASYTPLELFQLFFSTTVMDTLVKHTNAHGGRGTQEQGGQREQGGPWQPVSREDLYSFLALVLYAGVVPLETMADFWRGSRLYGLSFPSSVMSSGRFLSISRCLRLNDPAQERANALKRGTPWYDPLCRAKPLYEQILAACYTFFHPHQHLRVDQRAVDTGAKRRRVPHLRARRGPKLFVLADASCGYTLNFFVDVGKDPEATGRGRGYDIVMRLLGVPFLGTGYKLYLDSFYSSPSLFQDLLSRKIWACGTLRPGVAGFPKKKDNDMTEDAPRGTIRWLRRGQLLFVKWLDTRQVTMCSTVHRADSRDTTKRRVKTARGGWTLKTVPVPACFKDYSQYVGGGGADLPDALVSYNSVLHHTQKWSQTLFYRCVDIAAGNAFVLHREMCKLQQQPQLEPKAFREQLVLALAGIGSTPAHAGSAATQDPGATPTDATPPAAAAPAPSHLPAYFTEDMSGVTPRLRATRGRRTCVFCKKKSPVYCGTCKKTLCFTSVRNCYRDWHTRSSAPT